MAPRQRESSGDENAKASKRQRREAARGAISKIKVHNFMTYIDAEIQCGPRLNLVLGPNGTGKSSLVNAICLGLAGSTSLLGRADNVRDFVRRGEREGFIQIWLNTGKPAPGHEINIKRSLDAKENKSEWRLNGGVVNLRDIKAKVAEYNVQLDNLCQFLPQDKVVEFAKLKPKELLEETEKAIGDSSLYQKHMDLIERRNGLKTYEVAARTSKDELELQERANDALKRDVDRYQKRADLEAEVSGLTDKLTWVKYNDLKKENKEKEGVFKIESQKLEGMLEREAARVQPRKEKEDKQEAAKKACKESRAKLTKLEDAINKASDELSRLEADVEKKADDLEGLEQEYQKRETDIDKLQRDIARMKEEADEIAIEQTQTQAPDHSDELKALRLQKRDAQTTVAGLQSRVDEVKQELDTFSQDLVTHMEQQRRLSSIKVQRLKELEKSYPGISSLSAWLENAETRAMFKGKVFGPLLCEVMVDRAQNAAYLEQHCPRDLWSRFVTEFPEDQDLLAQESGKRFNFRPIVTNYSGNTQEVIRHRLGEASTFAQYDVVSTLDEVFQAPHTVKLVMCTEANLQETYCGNQGMTAEKAERFLEENKSIQRLLTPTATYMVRTSKYNPNARSMNVASMKPGSLLTAADNRKIEAEKAALRTKITELQKNKEEKASELHELEKDVREEEERVDKIDADMKRLNDATNKLKNKKNQLLQSIKSKEKVLAKHQERPDPREGAPAIKAEIQTLHNKMTDKISLIVDKHLELVKGHQAYTVAECVSTELSAQIREMQREDVENTRQLRHAERLVANLEASLEAEKLKLKSLKTAAQGRTGPLTNELKARFEQLPSGRQGIEDAITRKEEEINNIQLSNPRAMDEYNARRASINKIQKALEDQLTNVETQKEEIAKLKAAWLPELKKAVEEINKNFGHSFERIGCAGEVQLYEEADPVTGLLDFDKFAMHIRVRFRTEEELQLLTAHRQSGGERSVATILYLIAIQRVTVCPFRVVDEINQGMDPVNERKVFSQLVEAACQPDTPQCFLLTPKLLPNLGYNEHVTLLEIYNGALVAGVARGFKKESILGGRMPLVAAA